jgi:hypothetical protein|nr:MAG TPA_asm: hypothetical protein [Caudoviricetes sp.]
MIYYRQNKDGSIIDFVEYAANEIVPSFILEQYTLTERGIVQLADGTFVFADTVNIAKVEEEIKQKAFKLYKKQTLLEIEALLKKSDYKCLKYVDGELSEKDYEVFKQYRKELRNLYNFIEASNDIKEINEILNKTDLMEGLCSANS